MSNFTQGEWYIIKDPDTRFYVMSKGKSGDIEMNVCKLATRPEALANANLISAAPDMYKALKAAYDITSSVLYQHPDDDIARLRFDLINKSLNKAEGKST